MNKIVVYYLIAQYGDWWQSEFYTKQLERIKNSGLYDEIDFIEIHVANGKTQLPFIPEKISSIHYYNDPITVMNNAMISMWEFCNKNPNYKILFLHSDGVTHQDKQSKNPKLSHLEFIHSTLVDMWEDCTNLLNYYDCVGNNWVNIASFANNSINFRSPHFRSGIWWANSNYISKLNVKLLEQDVIWKRFLGELWIGTGNPRYYCIENTLSKKAKMLTSFYAEITEYDIEKIKKRVKENLNVLQNIDALNYDNMMYLQNNNLDNQHNVNEYIRKWT